jgi:hypothetical protein
MKKEKKAILFAAITIMLCLCLRADILAAIGFLGLIVLSLMLTQVLCK